MTDHSNPGHPMVITRLMVFVTLGLSAALASGPARAQSDYCYELAARICDGAELGPCFESEENWQELPDECVGDIQSQIEMNREFSEQNSGNPADENDDLVGSYAAFIGTDDLFNSAGKRLTTPWQVLRQDRANFHEFGISQDGDEGDPYFASADNRAAMEELLSYSEFDKATTRQLLSGEAIVYVEIYARSGRLSYINVEIVN